jgi:arsenate reductase
MAEGLLRSLYGDRYEAYSAGTQPSRVNPYAIKVMAEIGIDISTHYSKNIDVFHGIRFDYVVPVCNKAKEECPFFQGGGEYLHNDFDDPSQFKGNEDEKLAVFRKTRDVIKGWIEKTFGKEDKTTLISRFFPRTRMINWCTNHCTNLVFQVN